MKNYLLIFSSILFLAILSCKDDINEYSNGQDLLTGAKIGEITATRSSTNFVEKKAYTDYALECEIPGSYYLSAWMEIPIINGVLPEYQVKINGVLSENTFKPSQAGYQSLILTDSNNESAPVALTKGENTVTLVSVGREILNVGEFKAAANIKDAQIDDSEYQSYVKQLRESPISLNTRSASTSSVTPTQSDQIYDYLLNFPTTHTYSLTMYMEERNKSADNQISKILFDINSIN